MRPLSPPPRFDALLAWIALPAVLGVAAIARADDVPPGAPASDEPKVGVVTGESVNLRVGPRIDDCPVTQLEQGTVVLIVERAGEWLGVRLPAGFPVAISADYAPTVDPDHVKVAGTGVNLRVRPPEGDKMFAAFRDHPADGAVLPVIAREGGWVWVEAPEEIRAYIHSKFVKEVGTETSENPRVEAARRMRTDRAVARAEATRAAQEATQDVEVRTVVAEIGMSLLKLRAATGYDTAPIVALSERLTSTLEAKTHVTERTKALATALQEDLARETERRVAYHDVVVAKLREGTTPPPFAAPPAPKQEAVAVAGTVRWEPAPGWEGGGAFILWIGEKPLYALRWAEGDLRLHDQKPVKVKGRAMGGRLLGLPTIEVESVAGAAEGAGG